MNPLQVAAQMRRLEFPNTYSVHRPRIRTMMWSHFGGFTRRVPQRRCNLITDTTRLIVCRCRPRVDDSSLDGQFTNPKDQPERNNWGRHLRHWTLLSVEALQHPNVVRPLGN